MTKKDLVLSHLLNKGSITSIESFELYKATRLSGIIFNLKKEGYVIDTIDRKGKDCVYAEYVYKGKEETPYYQNKKSKLALRIKELETIIEQKDAEIRALKSKSSIKTNKDVYSAYSQVALF